MANRRMGTRLITGTIDFLNLPKAAQALYQQCVNESDDDGIVDARLILRIGNFRKRDLEALISGDYVRLINAKKEHCLGHELAEIQHYKARERDSIYIS